MITIVPFNSQDSVETCNEDSLEIVDVYEDGSILVRNVETGELRHIRRVTIQ